MDKKISYHRDLKTSVTPDKVFDGIGHVADWWAKDTKGNSQKLGGVFTIRFGETFVKFKVSEYQQDRKMTWDVSDCYLHWLNDKTEWKNTSLRWELTSEGKSTKIDFTHEGLLPEIECYQDCVKGWDQYVLGSLPKLLTTGKGSPD